MGTGRAKSKQVRPAWAKHVGTSWVGSDCIGSNDSCTPDARTMSDPTWVVSIMLGWAGLTCFDLARLEPMHRPGRACLSLSCCCSHRQWNEEKKKEFKVDGVAVLDLCFACLLVCRLVSVDMRACTRTHIHVYINILNDIFIHMMYVYTHSGQTFFSCEKQSSIPHTQTQLCLCRPEFY